MRIAYISKDKRFFEREIKHLNYHINFTLVDSIEDCRGRRFDTFMLGYDYLDIKDYDEIIITIKQNMKEFDNRPKVEKHG